MSDISELSTETKSKMLAGAMGWQTKKGRQYSIKPPERMSWLQVSDLYNPRNMSLAWRVLNWAARSPQIAEPLAEYYDKMHYLTDEENHILNAPRWYFLMMSEAEGAQGDWLDKCLELALQAGLVQLEDGDA